MLGCRRDFVTLNGFHNQAFIASLLSFIRVFRKTGVGCVICSPVKKTDADGLVMFWMGKVKLDRVSWFNEWMQSAPGYKIPESQRYNAFIY